MLILRSLIPVIQVPVTNIEKFVPASLSGRPHCSAVVLLVLLGIFRHLRRCISAKADPLKILTAMILSVCPSTWPFELFGWRAHCPYRI